MLTRRGGHKLLIAPSSKAPLKSARPLQTTTLYTRARESPSREIPNHCASKYSPGGETQSRESLPRVSGGSASRGERASHARMHSCARSSADLRRSRVRQLRMSRGCTRAARSCSRSTPALLNPASFRLRSEAIRGHQRSSEANREAIRGHDVLLITCCSSLNPASFRRASQHASHATRDAERVHTGQSPPKSSRSGGKWAKQWST